MADDDFNLSQNDTEQEVPGQGTHDHGRAVSAGFSGRSGWRGQPEC